MRKRKRERKGQGKLRQYIHILMKVTEERKVRGNIKIEVFVVRITCSVWSTCGWMCGGIYGSDLYTVVCRAVCQCVGRYA